MSVKSDNGQLAPWTESIITTGSNVSMLLMIILIHIFIVQAIRKTYHHFTLQKQIEKITDPMTYSYPVYNRRM